MAIPLRPAGHGRSPTLNPRKPQNLKAADLRNRPRPVALTAGRRCPQPAGDGLATFFFPFVTFFSFPFAFLL